MVTIAVSVAALLLAALKLRGLGGLRMASVFFALGAGQIHLAVLAVMVLLIAEEGYRLPRFVPHYPLRVLFMALSLISLVTLLSPVSGRTISELVQLFVYAVIFVLFAAYLRDRDRIEKLFRTMVAAASLVALIGIIGHLSGMAPAPHIYLGRGSNEGSFFLLICGVVPAMTLFLNSKRPIYVLLAVLMLIAQFIATSRMNVGLSVLVIGSSIFFLVRSRLLRALLIVAMIVAIFGPMSMLQALFEEQSNYSTLQRILLYDAGWSLWLDRPWIGWGWGSSSVLVPQNSLTDDIYPHFHSTYIQFIVELGALGWVYIAAWVAGSLWLILAGGLFRTDLPGGFYIAMISVALLGSGFTSAMLFGADRAVQVMLVLALIWRFRQMARLQQDLQLKQAQAKRALA